MKFSLEKRSEEVYTIIETDTFLQKADVYGMKQILIIPVVSEALNEYCILAMD